MKSQGQSKGSLKGTKINLFSRYLIGNISLKLFWLTLVFYLLTSTFSSGNKVLYLVFGFILIAYIIVLRNFNTGLFLAIAASVPISAGWTTTIQLITANELQLSDYPTGFNVQIVMSPGLILSTLAALILLRTIFLKRKFRLDKISIALIAFYLIVFISSLRSSFSSLSLTYFLVSLDSLILYFFVKFCVPSKYVRLILPIIAAMLILELMVAFRQTLLGGFTGSLLEARNKIETFGIAPDEKNLTFRPYGTFSHPNDLAAFLLPMILIVIPGLYILNGLPWTISLLAIVAGVTSLILTQGRSAWVSFAIGLVAMIYVLERRLKLKLNIPKKYLNRILLIVLLVIVVSCPVWFTRINAASSIFQESGGANTRYKLDRDAVALINTSPVWGVGLGLSPYYLWKNSLTGISKKFITAPHNYFLLLASETGVVSLFVFLITIYLLSRLLLVGYLTATRTFFRIYSLVAMLGILSLIFNALFQPIFNFNYIIIVSLIALFGHHEYK